MHNLKNPDSFSGTIFGEIIEIMKTGEYIDGEAKKAVREKGKGSLSDFEKATFTLYRGDMLRLRKLNESIHSRKDIPDDERSALLLERNILDEKIKTTSKLFTFTVRSRLRLWDGCVISVRKGFEVVLPHTYYTKMLEKKNLEKFIEEEMGVNTGFVANG